MIHGVSPDAQHDHKYGRVGTPLSETSCALFGRQLLQGLLAMQSLGEPPMMHVHCGNLFVHRGQQLRLAEWEGAIFGLGSPIEAYVQELREVPDPP